MKHLLLTTIAAVVLVGCGNPEADENLMNAANKGDVEAAKMALDEGADVNVNARSGRSTPLSMAAWNGHSKIAELLIAKGADVNAKRLRHGPPIWNAIMGTRKKGKQGIKIMRMLIDAGADVNGQHASGDTALHEAAFNGLYEVAELLIANGANVNLIGQERETPLDDTEPTKWNNTEEKAEKKRIADLLRKHGGKTGAELL
jgi:ankyrin repeat protein